MPSSFDATSTRLSTVGPVYTPRSVSKLANVLSARWGTLLSPGAVQLNHTDLPPALPAWAGSPASLVALTVVPSKNSASSEPRSMASANASLSGAEAPAAAPAGTAMTRATSTSVRVRTDAS